MSKPYVLDLTPKMQKWEQVTTEALEIMPDIIKTFPELYNKKALRLEDDHVPNLNYDTLEAGHLLYTLYDKDGYFEDVLIEITHLYGRVLFFKYLDGPDEGEEDYLPSKCLLFEHWTYPAKVKILPGWEVTSRCERVEFIEE